MHVRPRAKVNLTLSVGPRGRDGMHPLTSVFLRIGLSDDLTVAFAPDSGRDVLSVSGLPGAPTEGNLVTRAIERTRRALGHDLPPLVAHLDKRIPMGGGLGGGSSDAAAAIDAALQMWGARLAPERHRELAAELGSDVPFFAFGGPAALVGGLGERVEPLGSPRGELGVLLLTPPIEVSTAAAYAKFDELVPGGGGENAGVPDLDRLVEAANVLRDANDLWPAAVALAPALGTLRDELERLTGRPWLMSGSGSTLFALYPSSTAAADDGRRIAGADLESAGGAALSAVDLVGPDPVWRYP